MKKTSLKKMLAAMMAISCIVASTACSGGTADQNATTAATTVSGTAGTTAIAAGNDGPLGKYAEPVTLARAQMTFSGSQWQNGDTADNNPWTRAAKDDFNIILKDEWAADGSQYGNKINLSIASQTLPDVFWADCSQFAQVVKAGLAADLTPVYDTYASPATKELMSSDEETFNSGKVDGKLMGISTQHFGVISQLNCVWIRDDWMKKLGLSEPKTMDELITLCEKFTNDDPDGNGQNDTYGLALDKGLGGITGLMPAYHAYPNIWLKDSTGSIVYGSVQPEAKTALEVFRNMYKKGIISKEFGVKDGAKVNQDLVSGKVGVAIAGSSFGYSTVIDVVKKNGNEAIFRPYAIPSSDGQQVKLPVGWPVGNYIVINKNCKNPEAALKMVNLYVQKIQGTVEDYDTYINNERSWGAIPFQVQNPMADYNQYVQISAVQDSRDTSSLKPDQLAKYDKVIDWIDHKNPDSIGQFLQVSKEGAYGVMKPYVDNKNYVRTEFRGLSTPTMVSKNSTLESLISQEFTKIIMGQADSSFDNLVSQWKSLGGDQITKEMNDSYNK